MAAVRCGADHGSTGVSSALAAKMTDFSQRRLVFMICPFDSSVFAPTPVKLPSFEATVCRQKGNIARGYFAPKGG
jgi:hypothetical protein